MRFKNYLIGAVSALSLGIFGAQTALAQFSNQGTNGANGLGAPQGNYQWFGGLNAIRILESADPDNTYGVAIGPYAANALTKTAYGVVAIGTGALGQETNQGSESVVIGPYSFAKVNGQFGNTGVGEHNCGFDPACWSTTLVGVDAGRNAFGLTQTTSVGAQTVVDGELAGPHTVLGSYSWTGQAGAIKIASTSVVTTGDAVSVAITSGNSQVRNVPTTATFTVGATATKAALATGLANAIQNKAICWNSTQPTGAPEACVALSAYTNFDTAGNYYVMIHFPGGNTQGGKLTLGTPSCTGTCGETLTSMGPYTGQYNAVGGNKIAFQSALTTASFNALWGNLIATGAVADFTNNTIIGHAAFKNATNDQNSAIVGMQGFFNATNSVGNTGVGYKVGFATTSGTSNLTFIGQQVGSVLTHASMSNITLIGTGSGCESPSGVSNYIGICTNQTPVFSAVGANTPSTAKAMISGGLLIGSTADTTITMGNGALALAKITASGTAPGAGFAKMELVCGTTAGTAKLIAYAGTSTTPVTVVDNIGTGVTGC